MFDPKLLEHCQTERQTVVLKAIEACDGNKRMAARQLGCHVRTVERCYADVRDYAASHAYCPDAGWDHHTPKNYPLKGVSQLVRTEDGLIWYKSNIDDTQRLMAMEGMIEALKDDVPKYKPTKLAKSVEKSLNPDLMTQYIITDYHLGMYSWVEESGDDWDIEKAEKLLVEWFQYAIETSPNSETAVFAQMGDFLHWDGLEAVTPASKHVLDASCRFQLLPRVAIRVIRRIMDMLLAKHKYVHLVCCDANHDPASSAWLREIMPVLYENEPRVTVEQSPDTYYAYKFGKVLNFYHHGHKRNPANIDTVLVAKFREQYGQCEYHYANLGHLHNTKILETNLMITRQYRTLAAADAYASRGGWISGRGSQVTTFHKDLGMIVDQTISPEMIEHQNKVYANFK